MHIRCILVVIRRILAYGFVNALGRTVVLRENRDKEGSGAINIRSLDKLRGGRVELYSTILGTRLSETVCSSRADRN